MRVHVMMVVACMLFDLPDGGHLGHWHFADTNCQLRLSFTKYGEGQGKTMIRLLSVSTWEVQHGLPALCNVQESTVATESFGQSPDKDNMHVAEMT